MDIRPKRSDDGGQGRRAELESQLAQLRDQEAVLLHAIKLHKGSLLGSDAKPAPLASVKAEHFAAGAVQRPTLEPKDLESQQAAVRAEQYARELAVWKEVRATIKTVMSHKNVAHWFGQPVMKANPLTEAERSFNLSYSRLISDPMDFGLIQKKFGNASQPSSNLYATPMDVSRDIRLMVENCEAFNIDPNTDVRKACTTLANTWNKRAAHPGGFEQHWMEAMEIKEAQDKVRCTGCL